jgi:hypothetical protein
MKNTPSSLHKNYKYLGLVVCLAIGVVFGMYTVDSRRQTKETIADMSAVIIDQNAQMRIMAYHQAVAQLEQQYPLSVLEAVPAATWEEMLAQRTDLILTRFYEEHGQ